MAEHGELWQWLIETLEAGLTVVLLVVANASGSTPGKVGAKMAVSADACIGTIGGGPLEYRMVNIARHLQINEDSGVQIVHFAHHPSTMAQLSGAICGGEQTVLVYVCQLQDLNLFKQLHDCFRLGKTLGLQFSADGLQLVDSAPFPSPVFTDGQHWQYQETIGLRKQAYIIGGGHVSLALSKVLNWLEFDITVLDEREPPQSMQNNHFARRKRQIPYQNIAEQIPEGEDVFVFIMTHSHYADELVTVQLAKKHFAYLGLLGSRNKVAQIKASLAGQLSPEQWQQLHAPMGLRINSHTPEEIAISIAGEVVQMLNVVQV